MGTTFGIGGMMKGYYQDQLLLGGTVFGSADSAYGGLLAMWDLAVLPSSDRFYLSAIGSLGHYPRQRAYAEVPPVQGIRAMMAGGVVRFDFAVSEEGSADWVMFGHPF